MIPPSRDRPRGGPFLCLAVLLLPCIASAHVSQGDMGGGFVAGFVHPMMGLDHVLAMVAVGMWGGQLGAPAIWLLPVAFPVVMAFGSILGALGLPLPGIPVGIAVSAMTLGTMVALGSRPPLWLAAALVGAFAIFHGYPHGTRLAESSNAMAFAIGFVTATGMLHALGILIGLATRWKTGARLVRAGGAAIAASGVYFLAAQLIHA